MIMSRSFSKNKKPKAFGIRRKGSMPAMPLGVTQKSNKAAKSKASPKKTVGGKNADVGEKKVEEYDNLEYISPLPEEPGSAEGKKEEEVKMAPQKISNHLIAKRAFNQEDFSSLSADEVADKVLSLTHVHLEEERIAEIDNLEMLGLGVTNLYLHRNLITKIENLESMRNLMLLSLASNKITVVENLEPLSCLKALDLGYNLIESIRPGDIPPSVLYLTTDGNPLSHMTEDNWDDVYMSLELLRTHDCVDLDGGDEEEEEDEEEGGGDGEDQGEGGDAGGDERSRRPMGQECGGDDDDGDYDDFDHGDERAQAEKQVDWKSGQLSSVVGRMADAEKLFDASMEESRERRRMMVEKQRKELAEEMAEQQRQFLEAREGLLRLRALMDEEAQSRPGTGAARGGAAGVEGEPGRDGALTGGGVDSID